MRVAVLLTGQPRQLENGAWWFKNKVFPESGQIKVDYYCLFWNDGTDDLDERIKKTYNPVRYHVLDYDNTITEFANKVKKANREIDDWRLVPGGYRYNQLLDGDELTQYGYNFWGQYISCEKITNMVGNLQGQYDIVIKTRSDVAFNNMSEKDWMSCFNNINRNPIFHDKMLAPWLYIENGIPYFGDFAFISKPEVYFNYSKNMEQHCFWLASSHKHLWNELEVANFEAPPHWVWAKLSHFSKTNWLSFTTVWPVPFGATIIRYDDKLNYASFNDIVSKFNKWQQEHPFKTKN